MILNHRDELEEMYDVKNDKFEKSNLLQVFNTFWVLFLFVDLHIKSIYFYDYFVTITYVHVLQAPSGHCTSAGTDFSLGRGLSLTDVLQNRAGVL